MSRVFFRGKNLGPTGETGVISLNGTLFLGGGTKNAILVVNLRDFPSNNALFGLVIS